jgi:G3E family GTPase
MQSIPVGVISGFLGAGKTSLLNHILCRQNGLRIAVLVNDFGTINIDAQLISEVSGETLSLSNGCVCCTIRDDLVGAIDQLLARNPPPEHILVETSGISEPAAVAMGIAASASLSGRAHLDAIITVVDVGQILGLTGDQQALALDQIEPAHLVLMNKTDLASARQYDEVRAWLRHHAPDARLVPCQHGKVAPDLVVGIRETCAASLMPSSAGTDDHQVAHNHSALFTAWSWRCTKPLEFEPTYTFFKALPETIIRGKGLLNLRQVPDKRVLLQMVGPRITLKRDRPWRSTIPETQIVLIGERDTFDVGSLDSRLRACTVPASDAGPNPLADAVVEILRRKPSPQSE